MIFFEKKINNQYYNKTTWAIFLLPISLFFYLVIIVRKFLYKAKILKSFRFKVPVVIVGNITMGGTGKTPIIISLVNDLMGRKFKVGIISRGYKSKFSHAREVLFSSNYKDVGDEPLLLKKKLKCPVYVGIDRVKTGKKLLEDYPDTDLILSDDGLQHYALSRDFEIIVVDGNRGFGNHYLLPAGPLREPLNRLKKSDAIILNGPSKNFKHTPNTFDTEEINENYFSLLSGGERVTSRIFKDKKVVAITGIGNPKKFFDTLESKGISFKKHIYPDHYNFKQADFDKFQQNYIIMTEKDAIKCAEIKHNNLWVLPLTLKINKTIIKNIIKKAGPV